MVILLNSPLFSYTIIFMTVYGKFPRVRCGFAACDYHTFMKRFIVPASVLVFLLTACSGADEQDVQCRLEYWDGTVGTCLPEGWGVLDAETLARRGVPEETIAAFQADQAVSGQFPTVTVTRESLVRPTTPDVYSQASIRSVSVLPGYSELSTTSTEVDGDTVQLHVFSAQPVESDPARRFYQVSTAVGEQGYTMTAATPMSVDDTLEQQVLLILGNVTFVAPEE